MIVKKDDTEFTVTEINNTLKSEIELGQSGKRLDIRGVVDGGTLIVTISIWN